MSDLPFLSATEQARLVRGGDISPVELVETYLSRVEKLDGELNAYVTVAGDQALGQARDAEARVGRGEDLPPFHGVPIAIKDLAETRGLRTTFSTKAAKDYVPRLDAASVRRIKEAGFIVLGKTNTPEFGTLPITESELNGACHNPWDLDRTPGGSSGGAAAALAAGLTPIAHGSDGGGSIRIPASCCGVFGIKPSRGRVSSAPRFGEVWEGFSTEGPIARSVSDAAALLDVMSGYETGDPYWAPPPERPFADEVGRAPGPLRVAFTGETPNGAPVDSAVLGALEDAGRLLESLGHEIEEASPDWVDHDMVAAYIKVVQASPALVPLPEEGMEPINRALLQAADQLSSADYVRAMTTLHSFARKVVAFWDDYDLLLTPTLALPPVPIGWLFEDDDPWMQLTRSGFFIPFTPPFNITGQPAASLPLYWSDGGLPIGVQLVGRPADEATIIRVAAQLEAARPWADRRPPVS
ncbi:MAG: amidase [Actinomycetota bacterium]